MTPCFPEHRPLPDCRDCARFRLQRPRDWDARWRRDMTTMDVTTVIKADQTWCPLYVQPKANA